MRAAPRPCSCACPRSSGAPSRACCRAPPSCPRSRSRTSRRRTAATRRRGERAAAMERGGRRWSPAAGRPRLPRRGRVPHAALPPPCVVILFPCPNVRPKAQCTRSVTYVCVTHSICLDACAARGCALKTSGETGKGCLKGDGRKVHSDFFASRGEYAHTGHRPTQTTDWQSERRRGAGRGEQGMARQNIVGSARLQNQQQLQHRLQNQRGGHQEQPIRC